jgi:aryl-alcohol dehydrogenase-like predicted oxidoreductase
MHKLSQQEFRQLGTSDLRVSPLGLGCWPLAGMTSGAVTSEEATAIVRTSLDCGINFLDTAYCYGLDGESERAIAAAVGSNRRDFVIASKGGIHWDPPRTQIRDARPATLHRECRESLARLGTEWIDLYYLHAPDPATPLAESAGAIRELLEAGLIRSVGVSNVTVEQLREFQSVCPVTAVQPPYNMLQRGIEADLLPYCRAEQISVVVYWPLLKGLLAGKLGRDHVFPASDSRAKYPMFQGEEFQRNVALVEELRAIAADSNHTVAELVLNWTIQQPGITVALCGAKNAEQARENAGGQGWALTPKQLAAIDAAFARRGTPVTQSAVT